MRTRALCLILTTACLACGTPETNAASAAAQATTTKPESLTDRVSYAIGQNVGQGLKRDDLEVNLDYLLQGLRDALEGSTPMLTPQEIQAAMQEMQQKLNEHRAAAGAAAKQAGEDFLAENGKRPEVKTTSSGLQYEVLTEGSGPKPTASNTVSVHYQGTLIDGTVFDSSYERNQPATFGLGGVIPGWTEGLQLMTVGSKWKLFIPSELAYGAQGTPGGPIPPNAALVFEVELLEIK